MKTLYIIGNGFDLAHEIDTRYSNFHEWLRKKKYKDYRGAKVFVDDIENYTKGVDLWSDFERALGLIHSTQYLKSIIDETKTEHPIDEYVKVADAVFAKIEDIVKDQYRELMQAFRDWARDIKTEGAEEIFPEVKNEDNIFLSFNYTDTLEKIYDIPSERVMHIHGYAYDKKSEIVVGHGYDYNSDKYAILALLYEELPADGGDSADKLIEMLNETRKNADKIINKHLYYFNKLGQLGIEKIVVLGHSYGEVDWPYFDMINGRCPDAEWELRWHSCDDYLHAIELCAHLRLSKVNNVPSSTEPNKICKCWKVIKPVFGDENLIK